MYLNAAVNELTELLLAAAEGYLKVELLCWIAAVNITEILRKRAVEDQPSERSVDNAGDLLAVNLAGNAELDGGMESEQLIFICHYSLVEVTEHVSLAGLAGLIHRKVVAAEDHILRRYRNSLTVCGLKQVARGEHEKSRLCLRLGGQRYVYRHLVAVEVGVECRTYKRVELDSSSLYEDRLKRLNGQTVKRRCAVEQYGVLLDDILECVPYLGRDLLYLLLCVLDI